MDMDYNALSADYDLTRGVNIYNVGKILSKVQVDVDSFVLDFGCGTGNYACAVRKLTGAQVCGVEPSDGMREKALAKGADVTFVKGDHTCVPFGDGRFDLAYMTDVIHHVPDIIAMFAELRRVLKPGGALCVLTESHGQIETRFWSAYFPETITGEKSRYPDIPQIVAAAERSGLILDETTSTDCEGRFCISPEFMKLVRNKGYSMFRMIGDEAFDAGLARLNRDYEKGVTVHSTHGETLLWFRRP